MSKISSVLHYYEAIADISSQMLREARASHWDEVVALGERYQAAVESLRKLDHLDDSDRQARRELLTRILNDDATIRSLAAPELSRLGALIGNMKRQHAVLQTYCAPALNLHS
ncbi:flagellar protein FliT [Parapusillimonas granuli]|uniref:Flagellar protein FliT n=1 Tax=Parapusillimonas granuli TaxID=380911 RepID=A0A853G0I0_9BURK|nr:flagellar protein FliT [Parapusillimonas granuli]MBB5213369.1 flagellar protein FliT [Parapusillimonas granuli]MEB2398469.1 flagellar protein FliT [Alcaligenaceae bacterium]NYT51864.1 flagellar protein FliT [Parapusillimonas granuli]